MDSLIHKVSLYDIDVSSRHNTAFVLQLPTQMESCENVTPYLRSPAGA
ncbi:MAG: hypothetical protein GX330_06115 [Bacteroidales bacterium]|nr:hypothetical protein [Bacteroidales bacterium]